jgi:lambda family phage portal protein
MSAVPADLAELLGPTEPSPARAVAVAPPVMSAVVTGGAYEAGRTDGDTVWMSLSQSADDEIIPQKDTIDARVRDMNRNDGYVASSAALHKDGIVGSTYLLNAKPMTRVLFGAEDEVFDAEFQEEVETKFTLWAESANCWADAKRTKSLTEIVRMAVGLDLMGGEVLAAAEWMPEDGRPYRTAVQMIDADRLCDPLTGNRWIGRDKIRGGVERDLRGAPIAYHIRMAHPTDYTNPNAYQWRRVMARKPWGRPQILHLFEEMRPDQTRGISAMAAGLQEIGMLRTFRSKELRRAVLAASYAASIESELPSADVIRMMGGDDNSAATAAVREYLSMIGEWSANSKNLVIDGVKVPVMVPGTKLNIKNPGAESPQGDKWEASMLRYLAATLGVSYEQLSRDYSQTNYSSARAARGETEKSLATRKKRTADRVASFLYGLWLEEAINRGDLECLKRRRAPNFYEGLNAEAYSNCDWIGAGAGLIDPLKETQAYVLQLKNALTTKERVMAKIHGTDWRSESRQIAREMRNDEKLKIPSVFALENTDAENALSGTPQVRENDGESGNQDQ